MSPLLLLPTLLLSQTHARWAASVRAEVRARSVTAQDTGTVAAGDAELRPSVRGELFNGPWNFSGSYSPTLRTREPYLVERLGRPLGDHSHLLQLQAQWAKEAQARVFLGEYLSYGTLDLSTLDRPEAAGQGLPPPQPLRSGLGLTQELTTDTSAGVDWYLARSLTLTTSAGFLYGGGVDQASRASLPLQATVRGGARVSWSGSQHDVVGANLAVQYVRFYQAPATSTAPAHPGARLAIGELSASWARQLGPQTASDATLGVTGAFGQLPNLDPLAPTLFHESRVVAPLVALGLSHRVPLRAQRLDLRLGGQLAPFVDRFAGTAYQRLEASLGARWTHVRQASASLGAGVARSLPAGADAATTTVSAEASAGYGGDPWWRVDLTGRLVLVQAGRPLPPPPNPPFPLAVEKLPPLERQWVVGLSLTFVAADEQPRVVRE